MGLISTWWVVLPYAAIFFAIMYVLIPFGYGIFSYLSFVSKGNGFDEYTLENDEVWLVMKEIFKQIQVYNTEDGLVAVFILWILSTVLWFFGVPFVFYFTSILIKRVNQLKYDNAVERNTDEED